MLIRALVFGLVLSATPWSVFAASLSVPITVTERAGTPRKAEIVSLGVPLPKAEGVTIDGDPSHLDLAMKIVTNSLIFTECAAPPRGSSCGGYIPLTNQYTQPGERNRVVGTFATYQLEPLVELAVEAREAGIDTTELDKFLLRAVSWLHTFAYVGGASDRSGAYSALTLSYATDPLNRDANRGGIIGYNSMTATAAAYAATILRERDPEQSQRYMLFSRQLFRDYMFYREVRPSTKERFFAPWTRSKIWWSLWPATAPKELGLISRAGQFYLHTIWSSSPR